MIASLIKMLKAAEGPERSLDCWIWVFAKGGDARMRYVDGDEKNFVWERGVDGFWVRNVQKFQGVPRYTESIDAAAALCEKVLPGYGWDVSSNTSHIKACLNPEFGDPIGKYPHWAAVSDVQGDHVTLREAAQALLDAQKAGQQHVGYRLDLWNAGSFACRGTCQMKVLVACEYSGTVRNAFLDRGHDAWSCDLLPADDGSNRHIRGDARDLLQDGWDLLIVAHPPCTRLCNSGISWLSRAPKGKTIDQVWHELDAAAELFSAFWTAPIDRIAIENPIMHRHARERIVGYQPPAQTVAPWQFGEPIQKKICLWLKNLTPLEPTKIVELPKPAQCIRQSGDRAGKPYRYYFHQGKSAHERSRFFPGIAAAMAAQWGEEALEQLRRAA